MKVKPSILLLLTVGLLAGIHPARAGHAANVIGLVNLTNYQAALLVITDSPPDAPFPGSAHLWVTEDQSFGNPNILNSKMRIRVTRIDFTNRVVLVKEDDVNVIYPPKQTNGVEAAGTELYLSDASFDDALRLYGKIKGRTILVHPNVDRANMTFSANASNTVEAVRGLEKALEQRGNAIVVDGNRFVWIVPNSLADALSPEAEPDRLPARNSPSTNTVEALPEGGINFINVPLAQLLDVYQTLAARKWAQDIPLPAAATNTFLFYNQTPLNKPEILHAFDVLLEWRGMKTANVGGQTFRLIPLPAGK
jgi:hypothetical protein